jgi:hypothetical protein
MRVVQQHILTVAHKAADEPDTNGLVGGDTRGDHGRQIDGFFFAY